jgi:ferredoxin--NADP+ reductase
MYRIVQKKKLAEDTFLVRIVAPSIAKRAKPGNFVILRLDDKGERIPLTVADQDKRTVTLVFQAVGKTTRELAKLKKGNGVLDLVGPLGNPTEIKEFGTVCLVGGGLGIAPLYPIAKAMKEAGNKVVIVIGARSKNNLFWEDKLAKVSNQLIICTDDGSKGRQGFVTDALRELLRKKMDLVIAIGPLVMMKAVSSMTRQLVKTIVSINSIMIDGIGMCGGCRLTVNNETRFSCVDGPEFDGHGVDWDELINRNALYLEEEKTVCKCLK